MYIGSEFPKHWFYHQNAGCPAGFQIDSKSYGPLRCVGASGQLVDWSDADWSRAKQTDNKLAEVGFVAAAAIVLLAPGPWKLAAVAAWMLTPRSSW